MVQYFESVIVNKKEAIAVVLVGKTVSTNLTTVSAEKMFKEETQQAVKYLKANKEAEGVDVKTCLKDGIYYVFAVSYRFKATNYIKPMYDIPSVAIKAGEYNY